MSDEKSHPLEAQTMTLAELMQTADEQVMDPAAHEKEYRRGYCDGYIQAVTAFYEMTVERGISRETAYERLWDFWQEELALWQSNHVRMPNGDVQVYDKWAFKFPPEPDMKRK